MSAILLLALAAAGEPANAPGLGTPNLIGMMRSPAIAEVSGMAASRRDPDRLWAVNDSDHPPTLEALDRKGSHQFSVEVTGATNIDWEDLVAFTWQGQPTLLIADTGDNGGLRPHVSLYLVPEPAEGDRQVAIQRRLDVRFRDGPHDVEAVFVDEAEARAYLVAKRQVPPVLYSVPLGGTRRMRVATVEGTFATIPRATPAELEAMPRFARYFGQATSAVANPDAGVLALLTYRDAYLFRRRDGERWIDALRREPVRFGLPFMPQAEAIAFDATTREFLVTTENLPAPILAVRLPEP